MRTIPELNNVHKAWVKIPGIQANIVSNASSLLNKAIMMAGKEQ